MKLSFALFVCVIFGLAIGTHAGPSEPYAYLIYYGDTCNGTTATLRGLSSDQPWETEGRTATGRNDNATVMSDLCTMETICTINATSPQCLANEFIKIGSVIISISEEGLIYECDSTNAEAECSVLDGCYESSAYPNCHFQYLTASNLLANPSVLKHNNSDNEPALQESSYLLYYSDEECKNLEGIDGATNNGTNSMVTTDKTISCRDAMACAFHPESGEIGKICQDLLGVSVPPVIEFVLDPIQEDQAVPCDEKGTCEPVSPDTCQKSKIHPSCYYRLATSAVLFGKPEDFLMSSLPGDSSTSTPANDAGPTPTGVEPVVEPQPGSSHATSKKSGLAILLVFGMVLAF